MGFGHITRLGPMIAAALLLSGCTPNAPSAKTTDTPDTSAATSATKVLVIMEENHSYAQMMGGMPFLARMSETYGYATHWSAITHPSLPNYLAIAGGSTFGVTEDKAPRAFEGAIGSAPSVFDQALDAGKTASTYAESMPKNCYADDFPDRADGVPVYAVRHNPWAYFSSGRDGCLVHDQALTRFSQDVTRDALPNVGFLIPNLDHDAHDGSLATADDWLEQQLTPVVSSDDFTSGRLVVVVTADEDDKASGNTVLTSVLSPALSHKIVDAPLTHYSLTRYIAQVLGVTPLQEGADAPDMKAAFGL